MARLPEISPIVSDAILDMLISDQGMNRPPEMAAKLLALIIELHKDRQPFPKREEVAKAIGCSVATVDAALSTRLDEGYVTMAVETTRGNVQRRNSVIRERYYVPSQQLLDVANKAKRQEARAKRRG